MTPSQPELDQPRLQGRLGVTAVVFMVLAAAAPLTVIGGNVPLAISAGNGAGAPVGFLIASVVLLLFSVGFVAMTPHVQHAGAFFAYIEQGLGRLAGGGAAFLALVAYTAIQAGIWGYLGGAASSFVEVYSGVRPPWWLCSAVLLIVVALLGYRHIELSSRVLGTALVCELAIVLVMDGAIFVTGGASGISGASFTPAEIFSGPLGIAVLFSITGFIGFEATAVFRQEARDPDRTVPRATYIAVTLIGLFYALSSWAMVEGWGVDGITAAATNSPDDLMLNTAQRYLGAVAGDVMQVLLITSLIACVLSFHNVIARYQFALARRATLPAVLGSVHPRHSSPATSSLVQSATAAVLVAVFAMLGLDPLTEIFSAMAGVATLGIVLLMLLTSLAAVVFFFRNKIAGASVWSSRVAPVAAVLVLLVALWLVVSNFPLVVGSSVPVAWLIGMVPVIAFGFGWLLVAGKRQGPTS
ncbi:amino acid/polyamine/organocation transporter (APC superfamily) [Tamaricihabitans halophyticus]|uniref:Amino acid/polyamine/organocation transporter (APC superfamily) n=1 Tax=Tamaricihabitans halophyticus TaxID=1262583 RepID=A0A4R2QKG6_9PSEU|nr:APC family permease [Tamaricihabitans halophyticus]TCP49930.1 amino acid/polyamine/organocation transporter (APC superfamily) [Tamaricihabitans halophyticus]